MPVSIHEFLTESGEAYEGAVQVLDELTRWHAANANLHGDIFLFADYQAYGQAIRDLDIWMYARYEVRAAPKIRVGNEDCYVISFVATIELKRHSPNRVRYRGGRAEVRYWNRASRAYDWSDATNQTENQQRSLRNHLESVVGVSPHVSNVLWLANVVEAPEMIRNVLVGRFRYEQFLRIVVNMHQVKDLRTDKNDRHPQPRYSPVIRLTSKNTNRSYLRMQSLRAEQVPSFEANLARTHEPLQPSELDRKKVEEISTKHVNIKAEYVQSIGDRLLIFRGRGGAGKTRNLLRIGAYLVERGMRAVFLTYNKSLVSDVKRTLHLALIPDSGHGAGLRVQTIHSLIYNLYRSIFFIDANNPQAVASLQKEILDDDKYLPLVNELTQAFQEGLVDSSDLDTSIMDSESFVLVDEGQDWHPAERDLLYAIVSANMVVVADGYDQLVRSQHRCDWEAPLKSSERKIQPLRRSLRLKHNIASFANEFARKSEQRSWKVTPIDEMQGGTVVILAGEFTRETNDRIVHTVRDAGNCEVDMLYCVPPTPGKWVHRWDEEVGGRFTVKRSESEIARRLKNWGYEVWDGVSEQTRSTYPDRLSMARVVQYESCRGLEGWAVVNLGFDSFLQYKEQTWKPLQRSDGEIHFPQDASDTEARLKFAAAWGLIPLTRAIDIQVIHLDNPDSYWGTRLLECAESMPDVAEIWT